MYNAFNEKVKIKMFYFLLFDIQQNILSPLKYLEKNIKEVNIYS